jgi:hypothetical protein
LTRSFSIWCEKNVPLKLKSSILEVLLIMGNFAG